jgi:hypothetical protein
MLSDRIHLVYKYDYIDKPKKLRKAIVKCPNYGTFKRLIY